MRYVRYDPKDGSVLEVVASSRDDDFRARKERGETLVAIDAYQSVNPRLHRVVDGEIRLKPPSMNEVQVRISSDLARTDRYFTSDALDNVSQPQQAAWGTYRRQLRAAFKSSDAQGMLSMLPTDPKGADNYADLRSRPKS